MRIYGELETKYDKIKLNYDQKILPDYLEKEAEYALKLSETHSQIKKTDAEIENLEKTSFFTNEKLLSGDYKDLVEKNFPTIYSSYKNFVKENLKSRTDDSVDDSVYSEILEETWEQLFETDLLETLLQEEKGTRASLPNSPFSVIREKAEKLSQLKAKVKNAKFKHETEKRALLTVDEQLRSARNKANDCHNSIEKSEEKIEKLKANLKSKDESIESIKASRENNTIDEIAQREIKVRAKISDFRLGMSDLKAENEGKVKVFASCKQKNDKISEEYFTGYEPSLTIGKFRAMENDENKTKYDLESYRRKKQCEYFNRTVGGIVTTDEWKKREKYFKEKLIEHMETELQELQELFRRQNLK